MHLASSAGQRLYLADPRDQSTKIGEQMVLIVLHRLDTIMLVKQRSRTRVLSSGCRISNERGTEG